MTARDPIESALRRHFADEEMAARHQEAVDAQAVELLEGEHHPLRPENFAEAMSEMNNCSRERIRIAISRGDDKAAGAILRAAALDYWQGAARQVIALTDYWPIKILAH